MKTKKKQRNQSQQDCGGMFAQVQTSVEFKSSITVNSVCSVQDYRRLFIREPEVKARAGKWHTCARSSTTVSCASPA